MPHSAPLGPRPELGGVVSFLAVTPGASKIAPEAATASPPKEKNVVKALSARLASTFKAVNPSMVQPDDTPLRRVLTQPSQPASNGGLDNELGDLIVAVSDTIASPSMGQFEVLGHLGRGTFGQVLKVRSADNRAFALKVIRNRPAFLQQAEVEVELLRELRLPKPPAGSEGEGAEAARERAAASGDARAMVVQV